MLNKYYELSSLVIVFSLALWLQYYNGNAYLLGYSIAMAALFSIALYPSGRREISSKPNIVNYFLYYSGILCLLSSIIFINDGSKILHTKEYRVTLIGKGRLFQQITKDIFDTFGYSVSATFLFVVAVLFIWGGWWGMQHSKGSLDNQKQE